MTVDIGKLYDSIASHYDGESLDLLSAGREMAVEQIARHAPKHAGLSVIDLGSGTGATLVSLAPRLLEPRLHAVDLSAEMLAIARSKLEVTTIVADAAALGRHFEPGSVDVITMHYLTTFIDVPATLRVCRDLLRPGGLLSVVSTTQEAFAALRREVGHRIASEAELRQASPAPDDATALAGAVREEGLEICAIEPCVRPVTFPSFEACLDFGFKSGFFTHIIESLGRDRVASAAPLLGPLFPIDDEYRGAVILARRPISA